MPLFSDWLTVFAVGLVVVITPGANFAMTLRNSLIYSRQAGVYTVVGMALASLIHVAYCLLGIGLIISQSILLFNALKWLGAAYLIFIGFKSLRAKQWAEINLKGQRVTLNNWAAIRIGFLTCLLNPKSTLLYLAVFTQLIQPNSSLLAQTIYGSTIIGLQLLWYGAVALFISQPTIKSVIVSFAHWIERVTGAVLILLGVRLAIAPNN